MRLDAFRIRAAARLIAAPARPSPAATIPRWASAAGARDPRLVVVILRGALDGLSAVAPIGDPDYADLHRRAGAALGRRASGAAARRFFGLNPAMTNFARLYDAKQAMMVHATATNYRERSHFDGQDVLESGMPGPGRTESGWLNRAVAALPKGERVGARARWRSAIPRRWSSAARRRCSAGRPRASRRRPTISSRG